MPRTQLLIRMPPEDARRVRKEASAAFRTVSGYLLYVLERIFQTEQLAGRHLSDAVMAMQVGKSSSLQFKKLRTAMHLRCSVEQAAKIRRHAARRQLSISDFVVFSLKRVWSAADRVREG